MHGFDTFSCAGPGEENAVEEKKYNAEGRQQDFDCGTNGECNGSLRTDNEI
jgi:hypothetical protein